MIDKEPLSAAKFRYRRRKPVKAKRAAPSQPTPSVPVRVPDTTWGGHTKPSRSDQGEW